MGLLRSIQGTTDDGTTTSASASVSVTDDEVMRFVEEEEAGLKNSKNKSKNNKNKRSFLSSIRRKKDKEGETSGSKFAADMATMGGTDFRDDEGGDTMASQQQQPQAPLSGAGVVQPSASSSSTVPLGRKPSLALRSLVGKMSGRGSGSDDDVEGEGEAIAPNGADPSSPEDVEDVPPPTKEVKFEGPISAVRGSPQRTRRIQQPSARESAFSGAARYDWIDIETAAACKVQAAYRRAKTCEYLESQNMTTSFMRNRRRERKYRKNLPDHAASEDVPALLQMCGIGLLFGDAVEEDTYENREAAMLAEHRERRKEQAMREYELRESGMRRSGRSNNRSSRVEEMVDDL